MKHLRYFILGMLSILLFIPISDRLLELINIWIEALKVKPNMKVLNGKKDEVIIRKFLEPVCDVYDDLEDDFEDFNDE